MDQPDPAGNPEKGSRLLVSAARTVSTELSAKRRAAAEKRWGPPRVVRLDELTAPQRRLVLALVAAARKEADPEVETGSAVSTEGTRDAASTD